MNSEDVDHEDSQDGAESGRGGTQSVLPTRDSAGEDWWVVEVRTLKHSCDDGWSLLAFGYRNVALRIAAELLQPDHPDNYYQQGPCKIEIRDRLGNRSQDSARELLVSVYGPNRAAWEDENGDIQTLGRRAARESGADE